MSKAGFSENMTTSISGLSCASATSARKAYAHLPAAVPAPWRPWRLTSACSHLCLDSIGPEPVMTPRKRRPSVRHF